jgi:hypothetical protein
MIIKSLHIVNQMHKMMIGGVCINRIPREKESIRTIAVKAGKGREENAMRQENKKVVSKTRSAQKQ